MCHVAFAESSLGFYILNVLTNSPYASVTHSCPLTTALRNNVVGLLGGFTTTADSPQKPHEMGLNAA